MSIDIRRAASKTRWIAIVGTMLLTWLGIALWVFGDWVITDAGRSESLQDILQMIFLSTPAGLLLYGFFVWAMLSVSIIVLDRSLFGSTRGSIRARLLLQWGGIGLALLGWSVVVSMSVFLIPIVPLLLAQFYREKKMRGMLEQRELFSIAAPEAYPDV